MPFDRDGQWRAPEAADIDGFKRAVEGTMPSDAGTVPPTEALVKAIQATVPAPSTDTSAFFEAMSQIKGAVDIVIPVYGGLHVLKECVRSITERTSWKHRLIFVDDCSPDPEVDRYLRLLPDERTHLRNKKNRGFAATVNRGVEAGKNPYVIILNSDVIVTENWVTKMLLAMESNEKNVIVNPVTNNTALVNVNMYPGKSYLDMNNALEKHGQIRYPEIMPTGFCMMVRRAVWEEIGPFDEAFGSYGEETDWWFRAIKAVDDRGFMSGYRAVLAENCYLFHERGTSFSQLGKAAHDKQRAAGSGRFHQLNPGYGEWAKGFKAEDAVGPLRTSIPAHAFNREYRGNIAWAVKSTGPCGGMYYIADIANKLIEEGFNVKICLIPDEGDTGEKGFAVIPNLHCQPIKFDSKQDFTNRFSDLVFADGTLLSAVTELAPACRAIADDNDKIRVLNHVQSWDVDLANEVGRPEMVELIEEQYRAVPNIVVSDYVGDKIRAIGGAVIATIYPGVDSDLFHERDRFENGDERTTVAVLLGKGYPFKGYDRGVEVAEELLKQSGPETRVIAIGENSVPEVPGLLAVGSLSQAKIADLLGSEIDVLIDPATKHSYGLPGVEAVASGARFVCWDNEGVAAYEDDLGDRVKVLAPNAAPAQVAKVALGLMSGSAWVDDRRDPRCHSEKHDRHFSVDNFIKVVVEGDTTTATRMNPYKIKVISPHMRKHGGPTTLITTANLLASAGHDVSMAIVYDDWNPEVVAGAFTPISTEWEKTDEDTDVVLINSDNPFAETIMRNETNTQYIMYKLSHNPRFKEIEDKNLDLPWDHIVTTTEWLREACITPMEGWEHRDWDPEKVTTVGWYHYGHPIFDKNPETRVYGTAQTGFRVGTLIHTHPLKGSEMALATMEALKKKYEANVHTVGIGEVRAKLPWHMQYFQNTNRRDMAYVFQQLDVWLGASHSEGLGRMALEAMSAGVAVVTTNTGAEFLKDGENCLLYEPGDGKMAANLIDQLVNDQDLFSTIVKNGYDTAVEAANWHGFQTNLLDVIDVVMGETK